MTPDRKPDAAATLARREARAAWLLVLPALLVIGLIALLPQAWVFYEALRLHDLRTPWRDGWVGLAHYRAALTDTRLWLAAAHTAAFVCVGVALELALGLVVALVLDSARRARAVVRAVLLVPWAIPTAIAALLFQFIFDAQAGVVPVPRELLLGERASWFTDPILAWVPIILTDVWKTTPFVALLLLAGLQTIDRELYAAAELDGAGAWRRLTAVTIPLLLPTMLVAVLFRTLDGLRVFELVYVLTGGGPGTATEPLALYTFNVLLRNLRFGYGAALSVVVFLLTALIASLYLWQWRASLRGGQA